MIGNVEEWCFDRYQTKLAGAAPDPEGPKAGGSRPIHGGSYAHGDR